MKFQTPGNQTTTSTGLLVGVPAINLPDILNTANVTLPSGTPVTLGPYTISSYTSLDCLFEFPDNGEPLADQTVLATVSWYLDEAATELIGFRSYRFLYQLEAHLPVLGGAVKIVLTQTSGAPMSSDQANIASGYKTREIEDVRSRTDPYWGTSALTAFGNAGENQVILTGTLPANTAAEMDFPPWVAGDAVITLNYRSVGAINGLTVLVTDLQSGAPIIGWHDVDFTGPTQQSFPFTCGYRALGLKLANADPANDALVDLNIGFASTS